ncbi:TonB-dependent receptor [Acetobacter sp. TBRC 12305]|uniref:TonB-dependent receptor n=2 Tax=Acetobacter garciniae TaxID=2817435 RepID=A0A939HKI5_9PROT|nr:TonB-dependent receptor [Acetobacter garciniae]MBX0345150.1 TonB-dependent receptor [Acetobacter garciniae]
MQRRLLAAGSCIGVLVVAAQPAAAQVHALPQGQKSTVSRASAKSHVGVKPDAAPARARASGALKSKNVEELTVATTRKPHGTMLSVGAQMIAREVPGTNPMKVLGEMPGVMFQSADAQGLDNYTSQLYMHGFQQQEIGMTLDGIPLGEMTYRNYNGLNPLQAISSENVARLDVSQSAGAEDVAATNNLGGSIQYVSSDPQDKMGGKIAQTFGSYNMYHTFIRFDSGKLNESGTKFYASYMRNDTKLWKGWGQQFLQQVNAKLVQPVGEASKISMFFNWSDLHMHSYDDYSFEMLDKIGPNQNYYNNGRLSGYQTAVNAANGSYSPSISRLSDPLDAAYYAGGTNNVDLLGGLTANLALTDHLRWVTTVYGHNQQNQTTWVSPYFGSPTGSPLSDLVKEPEIRRFGILSSMTYKIAHNDLSVGVWYENNHYVSPMYAYAEPSLVNGVLSGGILNDLGHFTNPFAKIFSQTYNTNTFTGFFSDTYHVTSDLSLHFGFKSMLNTTRVGNGYLDAAYYGSSDPIASGVGQTISKPFLPHIGLDYKFLTHHELFIDISENVHSYAECGYKLCASPFSVLQSAYNASAAKLKPETDWTYAIGYRFSDKLLDASVYAYRTNFFNRLQQITAGSVINPVSAVANVGGVTMNGVDAALTIRPTKYLSLYNSISYNHAVYDQNITQQGIVYHLKNQQVINYPRFMYKARLSFHWKQVEAYIDGSYTGARNFSYVGDLKAPGYWMSNFGASYDFNNLSSYLNDLKVSLNISNLTGSHWISTMGEGGNPLSLSTGAYSYQSFMIGAPRMFFGSIAAQF